MGQAAEADTTGTVTGFVSDVTFPARTKLEPAASATVIIAGRSYYARQAVDASGFFTFLSVPPGLYVMKRRSDFIPLMRYTDTGISALPPVNRNASSSTSFIPRRVSTGVVPRWTGCIGASCKDRRPA